MVAFMNTLSSVLLATLLSVVLFATQGVNANALTDTLTGKIDGPATNASRQVTDQSRIQQSVLSSGSQSACTQATLDNIWMCVEEMCYCDSGNFSAVTSCLQTLVTNKEINNASGSALITQYGFTCIAKGQPIPGFNGASRLSSITAVAGGVVIAAVLSVVV